MTPLPTPRLRSVLYRLSASRIARMLREVVPGELPIDQADVKMTVAFADEVAQ